MKPSDTKMKATAVPCPVTTRKIIPIDTVEKQTKIPPRREPPISLLEMTTSQPTTKPAAKGHNVDRIPES